MAAYSKIRRIPTACAFAFAAVLTLTPFASYAHGGGGGGAGGGNGGGMGMGGGMGGGGPHGGFGLGGGFTADPGPFSHVSPGPSMNGGFGGQSANHVSMSGMSHSNGPNALDRDRGLNRAEDRMSARGALHSHALRHHHRHQVVPDADEMMNDGIH
jgi:hypothetical protein